MMPSRHSTFATTCLLFIFFLAPINSAWAISNIEKQRIDNQSSGWSSAVNLALKTKRGRSEKNDLKLGGNLFKHARSYQWLNWFNAEQAENNNITTDSSRFFHSRVIFKPEKKHQSEIFAQWQTNNFAALQSRILIGRNSRIRLHKSEQAEYKSSWFQGIGLMREWRKESHIDLQRAFRLNIYNHYIYQLNDKKGLSISNTLYFQPDIEDSQDYLATWQLQLSQPISQNISLIVSWQSDWDSRPPEGINQSNHSSSTQLKVRF